jgi:hypothetical protein
MQRSPALFVQNQRRSNRILAATQNVVVTAAMVSEIALEMKIQAATESTTVTASAEPADTKEPSGTNTVGDSAVRNMPNIDERFESLLPLIPGVDRGPNGLINMKGARTSRGSTCAYRRKKVSGHGPSPGLM